MWKRNPWYEIIHLRKELVYQVNSREQIWAFEIDPWNKTFKWAQQTRFIGKKKRFFGKNFKYEWEFCW